MTQLQGIRSIILDKFMLLCNFFDTGPFYFLLTPVIWFLYNRKLGQQLFYVQLSAALISQWLKALFAEPRPCQLMPELALIFSNTYGFPSGAAFVTTSVFGFLVLYVRKWWFTSLACLFVVVVGFSRVYLGMHFPSDVVGGYLFGVLLFFSFTRYARRVEQWFTATPWKLIAIVCLFGIPYFFSTSTRGLLSIGFGVTLGLFLVEYQKSPLSPIGALELWKRVVQLGLAVGALFLAFSVGIWPDFLYFLCGLWISFGIPKVCSYMPSKGRARQ